MLRLPLLCLASFIALPLAAQERDFSKVEIKTTPLRGGLHMLQGGGGNIVASAGADGVFIVDDQYSPMSDKIRLALKGLSDQPTRFVINTHWHGDHTGGNEAFGKANAVIVAHENVRTRMSTQQFITAIKMEVPPSPAAALPVVTFTDGLTLHLNGQTATIVHVEHAHTDGDALVHFAEANVLHMGDVYFNGLYPFIDVSSGGSIEGFLKAIERGIKLSDADTMIVPGHGALSNRAELIAYRGMLAGFRDAVQKLKGAGKSLEETIAAKPTAEFDEKLGGAFIKPEQLVEFIYSTL